MDGFYQKAIVNQEKEYVESIKTRNPAYFDYISFPVKLFLSIVNNCFVFVLVYFPVSLSLFQNQTCKQTTFSHHRVKHINQSFPTSLSSPLLTFILETPFSSFSLNWLLFKPSTRLTQGFVFFISLFTPYVEIPDALDSSE